MFSGLSRTLLEGEKIKIAGLVLNRDWKKLKWTKVDISSFIDGAGKALALAQYFLEANPWNSAWKALDKGF